ncbi:MAG TPA: DUF1697 domain-containing protein [Gemmatimonadales bacterium]|nr:DUF1697 domain-containing protein [Gemmatimonadales bacterium]
MRTCIALLRGVNVGGNRKVAMADLRALAAKLGFSDAETLLQSGNLVFRGTARGREALEALLEREASERLGLETTFMVRTAAEWREIVAANPFAAAARDDPGHLLVLLLKGAAGHKAVQALQASIAGPERVRGNGTHVYMTYPAGIGTSKVTNAVIERHLGTQVTGRNWNTVLKLDALVH